MDILGLVEGCTNFNAWVEIRKNILLYKKEDGGIALIYPNVSSYGNVSEWQSDCYGLVNGVKISGVSITSTDKKDIQIKLVKELSFLSNINVPVRFN
jgi:hypothetical protein